MQRTVCLGKQKELPGSVIQESAAALAYMTSEAPTSLDEIFVKLAHIDRSACTGIITSRHSTMPLVPIGLVLRSAADSVFHIISLECYGSHDAYQRGRQSKSS